MKSITAVGFDMDYTLAQYKPETFEDLAYRQACSKLVSELGYPAEVTSWKYDCHFMLRGLAVDKTRGNVLKIDRHKYVKLAFHGFRELSREERLSTYADAPGRESFDEPDYALLDTLFSLGCGRLLEGDAGPLPKPPQPKVGILRWPRHRDRREMGQFHRLLR